MMHEIDPTYKDLENLYIYCHIHAFSPFIIIYTYSGVNKYVNMHTNLIECPVITIQTHPVISDKHIVIVIRIYFYVFIVFLQCLLDNRVRSTIW